MAQIIEMTGWRERKAAQVQSAPALACPTCQAECPAVSIQPDESTVYRCVGHGHRALTCASMSMATCCAVQSVSVTTDYKEAECGQDHSTRYAHHSHQVSVPLPWVILATIVSKGKLQKALAG